MKTPLPKVLIRTDDGERFTRNRDGTYSMERTGMAEPYRYSYDKLMSDGFHVEGEPRLVKEWAVFRAEVVRGHTHLVQVNELSLTKTFEAAEETVREAIGQPGAGYRYATLTILPLYRLVP